MRHHFSLLMVLTTLFISCGTSSKIIVPLNETLPSTNDNYTIVWVGKGKAFTFQDGKYIRNAANDYAFEVVQRRYTNTWKSIKNMHRVHPNYDGKAGEREQTMFFEIDYHKEGSQIRSEIHSSLGNGKGHSDHEFREQKIQFEAEGISYFAPYNTYRITQHYNYEEGVLTETVELFKLENDIEIPFAKIEEKALIFIPTQLAKAPTLFE
ncbi:hypothetical protein [Flammeovirga agarivorans]|nr:hypothetical protein [Flammeovirga agarivorans]